MLTAIFACSANRVYAVPDPDAEKNSRNNDPRYKMPWKCRGDLEHFRKTTQGGILIMGRNTWLADMHLVEPKGRKFYVISNRLADDEKAYCPQHVTFVRRQDYLDVVRAIKESGKQGFVIGGEKLIASFAKLSLLSKIIVTQFSFDVDAKNCLTCLPHQSSELFTKKKVEHHKWMVKLEGEKFVDDKVTVTTWVQDNSSCFNDDKEMLSAIYHSKNVAGCRTGHQCNRVLGSKSITIPYLLPFNKHYVKQGYTRLRIVANRPVYPRMVLAELWWCLTGSTYEPHLASLGCKNIYKKDTSRKSLDQRGFVDREVGDMGPAYGFQWRHAGAEYKSWSTNYEGKGVDQLAKVLRAFDKVRQQVLKGVTPENLLVDRRVMVTLDNPGQIDQMTLPPCLLRYQFTFHTEECEPGVLLSLSDIKVIVTTTQRSWDYACAGLWNKIFIFFVGHLLTSWFGFTLDVGQHQAIDIHCYSNQKKAIASMMEKEYSVVYPIVKMDTDLVRPGRTVDELLKFIGSYKFEPKRAISAQLFCQPSAVKIPLNT